MPERVTLGPGVDTNADAIAIGDRDVHEHDDAAHGHIGHGLDDLVG
jgi:hypothetical protein